MDHLHTEASQTATSVYLVPFPMETHPFELIGAYFLYLYHGGGRGRGVDSLWIPKVLSRLSPGVTLDMPP